MKKELLQIRGEVSSKFNSNIFDLQDFHGGVGKEVLLPVSIFENNNLSALEAITKYMREEAGLRYRNIGFLLNRDERTIWGSYYSAKRKMYGRFVIDNPPFFIPSSLFTDRLLGVLEAIAEYMKEELCFRYCQIASLLNRDDRTIWTVYNRAKKKRRVISDNGNA